MRIALVGLGWPDDRGSTLPLLRGRQLQQPHGEMIADASLGLAIGESLELAGEPYRIVGLTKNALTSGGESVAFVSVSDAELIAFDQQLAAETALKPFANASRRVGQAQLKRLRPLRDHRLLQRYLRAVDDGLANGWHTLVYGLTLSVYSLPVLQGLNSYEKQTLLGFMHAVSRTLKLSENDCRTLLEQLSPSLPNPTEPILGDEHPPRTHLSF